MKRYGNLWEKVISIENLKLADRRARKRKTHSYGVRMHDKNREANIIALHEALLTKTYRTSEYTVFTIHEPKERLIYRLPYYPDRIVHHAVMNVLEPIWVKTFTYNTYSCIKGRGISGCSRQVGKIIKSFDGGPLYCLKLDITKFYPSINHDVAKILIRRKIKDKDLLWLLDEIIDSADGLPIGNYISQFVANLYLCYFMHYANERLPYDVMEDLSLSEVPRLKGTEYADDIVFMADRKEVLRCAFTHLRERVEALDLKVKGNHQIFPIAYNKQDNCGRALDYVGYQSFRNQKLMRKSIKRNLCRAVARANKLNLDEMEYRQRISSWLGWAKHSDSKHLVQTLLKQNYYANVS